MFRKGIFLLALVIVFCLVQSGFNSLLAEDTPYELNDSLEQAYFIGTMKSLQGKFETENDVDYYKIIVTHPGMLKLLFVRQNGKNGWDIQIVDILDKVGSAIVTQRIDQNDQELTVAATLQSKGIYYIRISLYKHGFYNFNMLDQNTYYTLKIVPLAGLILADQECSADDVEACQSDVDCTNYGGYWYDDSCHVQACNERFLSICPDADSCSEAGGYWSETKEFCFNGDISDIESQLADAKKQGYQEGEKFCKENPEECGITVTQQNCEETTSANSTGEAGTGYQASCASYNMFTNTLHVPCLLIGTESYWIDMMLGGNNPILFKLTDFGKNE